jgi:hypothetical protein
LIYTLIHDCGNDILFIFDFRVCDWLWFFLINKLNYSNDLESCAADWAILLCLFFFVLYKEEKIKKKKKVRHTTKGM